MPAATRALVEEYDDGQLSMPGDPSPLGATEPRPLSPRDDTGPMPTAAPVISGRGETANETPEVRWELATRGRRFFSAALDAQKRKRRVAPAPRERLSRNHTDVERCSHGRR